MCTVTRKVDISSRHDYVFADSFTLEPLELSAEDSIDKTQSATQTNRKRCHDDMRRELSDDEDFQLVIDEIQPTSGKLYIQLHM